MAIAAALIAYLIGSVSFAVVVSRAMRLPDPRTYGSNNPGATNVLRTGRKSAAVLTLLGDCAKGWFAVFLTEQMFATEVPSVYKMSLVAVAVVLGHMYPVFHRFQGGKGVATALRRAARAQRLAGAGVVATWIIIAVVLPHLVARRIDRRRCPRLSSASCSTACIRSRPRSASIALLLIWRHKIEHQEPAGRPRAAHRREDAPDLAVMHQ